MRRFILVDGETAEETEGIKWSNGCVTLDLGNFWPHTQKIQDIWYYASWDDFKAAHDGCGVTWIDQEAKEEELAHAAN
jgi:hypothetical protein